MKALEERILKEGRVLPGEVIKIDCFLNQQIDVDFIMEMGKEIKKLFENERVDRIITIESSGISVAFAAGYQMKLPVVFAKKTKNSLTLEDFYSSKVVSYTRKKEYEVIIDKNFIKKGERVLLIDDLLAKGNALYGLIDIVNQAEAELAGCAIVVEKGFQGGGDELRAKGIKVESLAIIESMTDDSIEFRK